MVGRRVVLGFWLFAITAMGCGDNGDDGNENTGVTAENTEEMCQDGIDNDGDGAIDNKDVECAGFLPPVVIEAPDPPEEPIEYAGLNGYAQNPIVSHIFTADPSANVFEDRIYVYASHDPDDQDGYNMKDYHIFSSDDLVNWQDHGVGLDTANVSWAGLFYAPDAAYSAVTGKYYLYFPNGASSIGVAVSDHPGGPFEDALGEPLVNRSTPGVRDVKWIFDPTCFVDDDGQAYLYFGGGDDGADNLRVIRLGEDMISLADEEAATIIAPDFFEAAFLHKRDDMYYLSYSTSFTYHSAEIDYLISDNPMTGFEYAGTILPSPDNNNGDNNHHSIVEYEGEWYIFYHNRVLANRYGLSNYQRSITLDHLSYDDDGFINEVSATRGQVEQLKPLDAFSRLEAEAMADQRGIEVDFVVEDGKNAGVTVTDIHNEDWIGYSQVDFGDGVNGFTVQVASDAPEGGAIHLYIDGADVFSNLEGEQIGTCEIEPTGGWQKWTSIVCGVTLTEGVHDLYLRFAGAADEPLLNIDYFTFE